MDLAHAHDANKYYIPTPSPWPIIGAIALFSMMLGAICYLNEFSGAWSFLPGAALLIFMFSGWFHTVIGESQHGTFNLQVDKSFRMGMMWFIFSEVMFFVAFFGALFYARRLSVPWLGGLPRRFLPPSPTTTSRWTQPAGSRSGPGNGSISAPRSSRSSNACSPRPAWSSPPRNCSNESGMKPPTPSPPRSRRPCTGCGPSSATRR